MKPVSASQVFTVSGVRGLQYSYPDVHTTYRNDVGQEFINIKGDWFEIEPEYIEII